MGNVNVSLTKCQDRDFLSLILNDRNTIKVEFNSISKESFCTLVMIGQHGFTGIRNYFTNSYYFKLAMNLYDFICTF